jgi:hypothetical protein
MINYNNKIFKPVSNSKNGETTSETIFHYKQENNILSSIYAGGKIKYGHLIGIVENNGSISMHYHQININNEIMTGVCKSTPVILGSGKIRLHENWEWTSGDFSKGSSILEEQ